jgi:hypothetical protein
MGFNKKIVGKSEIELIDSNLNFIKNFLKADVLFFENESVKNKFKEYEKKFVSERSFIG